MHNFCCLCLSLSGWISYFACLLPDLFHSHSESAVPKSVDHPELLDRFGSYVEERLVNIHYGLDMTHQDPTFTSFHGTALSDVEPVSEGSIRMHISQRLIRSFEEVRRGRLCQDPAGNRTTQRPPDHCKETQTAVVWLCLPFSLSSGLAKAILQATVKGGRRQGRQRKRWEDNIREWTGLEFAKSQRAVENREEWMKLVVRSSVVTQ